MKNMLRNLWIVAMVTVMASCVSTFENVWLRQANEVRQRAEFDYGEPCIECCEKRSHGAMVVQAEIIDDCVSSPSPSMSMSPSMSPTTPYCLCCEFRKQGYVVVIAEITRSRKNEKNC